MFKALLHKQMLEIRRMYFRKRRKAKSGSSEYGGKGLTVLFAILYLIIAASFYALSSLMGHDLMTPKLSWIYFMIMNGMAFLAGVLANIFSAASILYQAKDNEFLSALPIPPFKILVARMLSLYIIGLIYESMIIIPAIIYYFINGRPSLISIILCILGIFVLGIVVLIFSCAFGWLVALVSSRLKNRSFLSLIVTLVFIGLIMWFRYNAGNLFRGLSERATEIGDSVRGWGYPLYALGLGMGGDILSFLAFTAIAAALFALTVFILSKSFLRIVSVKNGTVKKHFSGEQIKTGKISSALRKKEFKRFTSSTNYMLNCGLGAIFLIIGAVFLILRSGDLAMLQESLASSNPTLLNIVPVAGTFAVCLLTSFCDVAAPAISLEGKNVWQLQVLPLDPYAVFKAKIFVHIFVAGIPALICTGALIYVLKTGVLLSIFMILCVMAYVWLSASAMLSLDLKRPMMDWTSEVQPIKQSLNILFGWLGSIVFSIIFIVIFFLVSQFISAEIYLIICTLIIAALTFLDHKWLQGKGCRIFAGL